MHLSDKKGKIIARNIKPAKLNELLTNKLGDLLNEKME